MKFLGLNIPNPFSRSSPTQVTQGYSFSFNDSEKLLKALGITLEGVQVTPRTAFSLASYYGSVRVIADMLASQPFILYRKNGKKRVPAEEHQLYSLLNKRPCHQQSSFIFRRTMMTNVLTYGFAIARIERDGYNRPVSFRALDSSKVSIYQTLDEELFFTYQNGSQKTGFDMLPESEVIHLKAIDFGGLTGFAPSGYNHATIKIGLSSKVFVQKYYENGTFLGGLLTTPASIKEEEATRVKKSWKDSNKQGVENAGDIAVLGNGLTFQSLGKTPVESQMVEFFQKCDADIYKILGVPPYMLGDVTSSTSWGSGIEQQFIGFVNVTLLPYLRQLEEEIDYKCLRTDEQTQYFCKIDLNDLLRGDIKTRMEYYRTMTQNGLISQNEAREMEQLDSVEGGDSRWIQQNMMPIDKAEEILMQKSNNKQDAKQPKPDNSE